MTIVSMSTVCMCVSMSVCVIHTVYGVQNMCLTATLQSFYLFSSSIFPYHPLCAVSFPHSALSRNRHSLVESVCQYVTLDDSTVIILSIFFRFSSSAFYHVWELFVWLNTRSGCHFLVPPVYITFLRCIQWFLGTFLHQPSKSLACRDRTGDMIREIVKEKV